MEVERNLIKFNEKLKVLTNPQYIIIHHTEEVGWNIYKVDEYHKSLGWNGIGYNYFIEEDGRVEEARGMNIGAHTIGFNNKSIGICLSGNFDFDYPSNEQIESLYKLCNYFMNIYNIEKSRVLGHREINGVNKSCPGYNFNMNKFRASL